MAFDSWLGLTGAKIMSTVYTKPYTKTIHIFSLDYVSLNDRIRLEYLEIEKMAKQDGVYIYPKVH